MTGTKPVLIDTIDEMRHALASHRAEGKRIGLVPTMGALHAGHASLIRRARSECDIVVVSIYVNPTQFGPSEDFSRYPRRLEADLDVCGQEHVDFTFTPSDNEMYAGGSLTSIHMNKSADESCGAVRPGHFDGVCLIVTKLSYIVQPDVAYFGQKDAQQVVVLQRMVKDLNLPVEIAVCPIVREPRAGDVQQECLPDRRATPAGPAPVAAAAGRLRGNWRRGKDFERDRCYYATKSSGTQVLLRSITSTHMTPRRSSADRKWRARSCGWGDSHRPNPADRQYISGCNEKTGDVRVIVAQGASESQP